MFHARSSRTGRNASQARSLIEPMEGRILLSATTSAAAQAAVNASLNGQTLADVLDAKITGITLTDFNKQINVQGSIAGATFTLPVASVTATASDDPLCPTLHFEMDAQTLSYNGFTVETSPICISVTPDHYGDAGQQLLCTVGQLLLGGNQLGNILTGIVGSGQGATLSAALSGIFSGVLAHAVDEATASLSASGNATGNKSLDTITLTLEAHTTTIGGYEVSIDDCDGGDVTATVTADAGAGKKVLNALGSLNAVLNSNASAVARANAFENVARAFKSLL